MASIRRRNSSWQVQVSTPNKSISASFLTLAEARAGLWRMTCIRIEQSSGLPTEHFRRVLGSLPKSVLPFQAI